jgi:cytochrome oxidase Cu insertion factor (SCO1/SenC/PrrC family)
MRQGRTQRAFARPRIARVEEKGTITAMKRSLWGCCLLILLGCKDASDRESTRPSKPTSGAVGLKVGDAAPEIEGKDMDGKSLKLSDFRGKVVLLDFWASW